MYFELASIEALWEVLPKCERFDPLDDARWSPSCLKLTTHMQAMISFIFDVICASRL